MPTQGALDGYLSDLTRLRPRVMAARRRSVPASDALELVKAGAPEARSTPMAAEDLMGALEPVRRAAGRRKP